MIVPKFDAQRAQEVFVAALELPDLNERDRLLDRECGDDSELRRRVEALLDAHGQPDSFLDQSSSEFRPTIDSASPANSQQDNVAETLDSAAAGVDSNENRDLPETKGSHPNANLATTRQSSPRTGSWSCPRGRSGAAGSMWARP